MSCHHISSLHAAAAAREDAGGDKKCAFQNLSTISCTHTYNVCLLKELLHMCEREKNYIYGLRKSYILHFYCKKLLHCIRKL